MAHAPFFRCLRLLLRLLRSLEEAATAHSTEQPTERSAEDAEKVQAVLGVVSTAISRLEGASQTYADRACSARSNTASDTTSATDADAAADKELWLDLARGEAGLEGLVARQVCNLVRQTLHKTCHNCVAVALPYVLVCHMRRMTNSEMRPLLR